MNNIQMIYGLQRVRQGLPATELSNQALDIAIEHYRMPYTHRNGEALDPTEEGWYYVEYESGLTIDLWQRLSFYAPHWNIARHLGREGEKVLAVYGPIPEPIKVNPHAQTIHLPTPPG
jgi:hypothetical protein